MKNGIKVFLWAIVAVVLLVIVVGSFKLLGYYADKKFTESIDYIGVSRDGSTILVMKSLGQRDRGTLKNSLYVIDRKTTTIIHKWPLPIQMRKYTINTDGSKFAYTGVVGDDNPMHSRMETHLLSTDSGDDKLILINGQSAGKNIQFMDDGKSLFLPARNTASHASITPADLYKLDVQTMTVKELSLSSLGISYYGNINISDDGQKIILYTSNTFLPADKDKHRDLYFYDSNTRKFACCTIDHKKVLSEGRIDYLTNTPDCRYVAFVKQDDTGRNPTCFYIWDIAKNKVELVKEEQGYFYSVTLVNFYSISADGRYVFLHPSDKKLKEIGMSGKYGVFRYDRHTRKYEWVSNSAGNAGSTDTGMFAISADGRYVAMADLSNKLRKKILIRDMAGNDFSRVELPGE